MSLNLNKGVLLGLHKQRARFVDLVVPDHDVSLNLHNTRTILYMNFLMSDDIVVCLLNIDQIMQSVRLTETILASKRASTIRDKIRDEQWTLSPPTIILICFSSWFSYNQQVQQHTTCRYIRKRNVGIGPFSIVVCVVFFIAIRGYSTVLETIYWRFRHIM